MQEELSRTKKMLKLLLKLLFKLSLVLKFLVKKLFIAYIACRIGYRTGNTQFFKHHHILRENHRIELLNL